MSTLREISPSVCGWCAQPLSGRPTKKWCAEACRLKAYRAAHPEAVARQASREQRRRAAAAPSSSIRVLDCSECNALFTVPASCSTQETCSKLCRNRRERRLYRATRLEQKRRHRQRHPEQYGWTEAKKAADQRRRARKRTGRSGDRIVATEIHERDGWRCGLCGEPALHFVKYPHPRSASIDHVVPLALGGDHSASNVQTAHLECNVRKGARTEA